MQKAVIVDGLRTPIGKLGGALKDQSVNDLATLVIKELIERTRTNGVVDEVILGHTKQTADASNLARLSALTAGLEEKVTGYTIHQQCGSGLRAICDATLKIQGGESNVILAGGAESMSNAPYYLRNARFGYKSGSAILLDPNVESQPNSQPKEIYGELTMGLTAENLAEQYKISRSEQDEFALRSQELASNSISKNIFKDEIIPVCIHNKKESEKFEIDEHPRKTSIEKLNALPPVFKGSGTVTAGNSSGRNDAAACLLLMEEGVAKSEGKTAKAKVISYAVTGVSPAYMGIGPVSAIRKALSQAKLGLEDVGLFEINEAFAAQLIAVNKELVIPLEKINVNGGAIAFGHPIGATGAILTLKLINELERRSLRYGVVSLCIAGGMGIAAVVENLRI
ncbi:thiolase family protein [Shouchella clausii]|uniref:thiolase family protein n=1 Tax=Shouchella clausii TaxID=79880 RepID=UPI000797F5ED|nr:thiolase family protein [Shouchella clausii]KKI85197.1 acetyl-CoA acetyltransferase [Shouchella clausii]